MARDYRPRAGYGIDPRLVDDKTPEWKQSGNAPGWAAGMNYGMQLGNTIRDAWDESDSTDAATAASTQSTVENEVITSPISGLQGAPVDQTAYSKTATGKRELTAEGEAAVIAAGDEVHEPSRTLDTETRKQYRLGKDGPLQDTPFTREDMQIKGLQARADFYDQSKSRGAAQRAEAYRDRIAELGLRKEEAEIRGIQKEVLQIGLEDARRTGAERKALRTAMDAMPALGEYRTADGKPAKKGDIGATPQTKDTWFRDVARAYKAGGNHEKYGEFMMKADAELNRVVLKGVQTAKNLTEINEGPYGRMDDGKDLVEMRDPNTGGVAYGYKGEKPIFVAQPDEAKHGPAFTQFKSFLTAYASDNPDALPAMQRGLDASKLAWAKLTSEDNYRKELVGIRKAIEAGNKKETKSETIHANARNWAEASVGAWDPVKMGREITDADKKAFLREGYAMQLDKNTGKGAPTMAVKDYLLLEAEARERLSGLAHWPKGDTVKDDESREKLVEEAVQKKHGVMLVKGIVRRVGEDRDTGDTGGSTANLDRAAEEARKKATLEREAAAAREANTVGHLTDEDRAKISTGRTPAEKARIRREIIDARRREIDRRGAETATRDRALGLQEYHSQGIDPERPAGWVVQ